MGARNGKGARFAIVVFATTSITIGLLFWVLTMLFHDKLGWIFTLSKPILEAVNELSILLALGTITNLV